MRLFDFLKTGPVCRFLADPQGEAALRYRHFLALLEGNHRVLDVLAALEQTTHAGEVFTAGAARQALARLEEASEGMTAALLALSPGGHGDLPEIPRRILSEARAALDPPPLPADGPATLELAGITAAQAPLVGGKAANLARVRNELGLPTPDGFAVTTAGYASFMAAGLDALAARELEDLSPLDLPDLERRCARIREAMLGTPLPGELERALEQALDGLARRAGGTPLLAVRSSAVGEDGRATFAGQYGSVLNVPRAGVAEALKKVFAGKYAPRAVLYRLRWGLDDRDAPMAALVLTMVPALMSGVLYTLDPDPGAGEFMRVDCTAGLGEALVSGATRVETARLARSPLALAGDREDGLLPRETLLELGRMGLVLETHFGRPQDVEWCVDGLGRAVIVQARPLEARPPEGREQGSGASSGHPSGHPSEHPSGQAPADAPGAARDQEPDPGHPVLVSGGVCASPGAASGPVLRLDGLLPAALPAALPDGAILTAVNAAPELAALLDRAGGMVTALGGVASHLASVAREMGLPALFGVGAGLDALAEGREVTLDATGRRVLDGRAEALLARPARSRSRVFGSPMHTRLRAALDLLSPLSLTDPDAENFTPGGCRTLHDVVRYAHEKGMREMFGLGETEGGGAPVVRLKARIPLVLSCADLGGGLRESLTTCDGATPEDIRSAPMRAIWRGFTHPGITWSGTVAFDARNLMTLLAAPATAEVGAGSPGGDSYALLGADYMNLSARFGYHFANIDALCGEPASRNHVRLRFAGGVGPYSGQCLRVAFLTRVLARLGFTVAPSGAVLEATFQGAPARETGEALDQLGRLMAVSRLLDMAIASPAEAEAMAESFLQGDYDLLSKRRVNPLPAFHLVAGDWECAGDPESGGLARQDGSHWASGLTRATAAFLGRLGGPRYQRFLDDIRAYFHFPLALAKRPEMGEGRISVQVRPVSGHIDQAAGLAFAARTAGDYLVFRINALEDNAVLFEFQGGERRELASEPLAVRPGEWRELAVQVSGGRISCLVDGQPVLTARPAVPLAGLVGLWTKADSVSEFRALRVENADGVREIPLLPCPGGDGPGARLRRGGERG
jgi:pyruvate,water dikinase